MATALAMLLVCSALIAVLVVTLRRRPEFNIIERAFDGEVFVTLFLVSWSCVMVCAAPQGRTEIDGAADSGGQATVGATNTPVPLTSQQETVCRPPAAVLHVSLGRVTRVEVDKTFLLNAEDGEIPLYPLQRKAAGVEKETELGNKKAV